MIEQVNITILYSALLGLMYSALSVLVVIQRRKTKVSYGDGDVAALRGAIRAHGNFAEYVPITLIIIGLLETTGLNGLVIHGFFLGLIVARIFHAKAMLMPTTSKSYFLTRVIGALSTWLILLSASILLLVRAI